MNRRSFLKWLGIGVPAAVAAAVAAPKVIEARLGEWNNYYSEGDPELMEAIEVWRKNDGSLYYDRDIVSTLKVESNDLFEKIASRRMIPINAGMKREFFTYNVG